MKGQRKHLNINPELHRYLTLQTLKFTILVSQNKQLLVRFGTGAINSACQHWQSYLGRVGGVQCFQKNQKLNLAVLCQF